MGDLHILPALLREDLRELVDVAGGVGQSAELEPEDRIQSVGETDQNRDNNTYLQVLPFFSSSCLLLSNALISGRKEGKTNARPDLAGLIFTSIPFPLSRPADRDRKNWWGGLDGMGEVRKGRERGGGGCPVKISIR